MYAGWCIFFKFRAKPFIKRTTQHFCVHTTKDSLACHKFSKLEFYYHYQFANIVSCICLVLRCEWYRVDYSLKKSPPWRRIDKRGWSRLKCLQLSKSVSMEAWIHYSGGVCVWCLCCTETLIVWRIRSCMYLLSMHVSYVVFLTAWLEAWPMIERSIVVLIGSWITLTFSIYFCPQNEKRKSLRLADQGTRSSERWPKTRLQALEWISAPSSRHSERGIDIDLGCDAGSNPWGKYWIVLQWRKSRINSLKHVNWVWGTQYHEIRAISNIYTM